MKIWMHLISLCCSVWHQPYLFYSNDIIIQSKTHFNITIELLVFCYAEKNRFVCKIGGEKPSDSIHNRTMAMIWVFIYFLLLLLSKCWKKVARNARVQHNTIKNKILLFVLFIKRIWSTHVCWTTFYSDCQHN